MKKGTFSIIIVPHDLKKTRTYRVRYGLFYAFLALMAIGVLTIAVFIATYGKLLVKANEAVILERQVDELSRRNEQVGELMRNITRLKAMNLQVRKMLGVEVASADSMAVMNAADNERVSNREMWEEQARIIRAIPSFWPVRGYITKGYSIAGGEKDAAYHPGIDIGVERGTPVRASASGYVIEAVWDDVYGYCVRIDHGYGIKTLYGHNERLLIIKGERVGRGQTIAYSGNTGKSTAPHLHFEVTKNNIPVDPLKYLLK